MPSIDNSAPVAQQIVGATDINQQGRAGLTLDAAALAAPAAAPTAVFQQANGATSLLQQQTPQFAQQQQGFAQDFAQQQQQQGFVQQQQGFLPQQQNLAQSFTQSFTQAQSLVPNPYAAAAPQAATFAGTTPAASVAGAATTPLATQQFPGLTLPPGFTLAPGAQITNVQRFVEKGPYTGFH